jgi:hypothetical protein
LEYLNIPFLNCFELISILAGNSLNSIFDIYKQQILNYENEIFKFYSKTTYEKSIELLNNNFHDIFSDISYRVLDDSKCQIELFKKLEKLKIIFQANKLDSMGKMLYQISYKKVFFK